MSIAAVFNRKVQSTVCIGAGWSIYPNIVIDSKSSMRIIRDDLAC